MLEQVKMLLGITGEDKDGLLTFTIESATDIALGYCRLETLPSGMDRIVARMAADMYRAQGYGQEEMPVMLTARTEGAETFNFTRSIDSRQLINNYTAQLKPFCNRKGRLPSEII